MARSFLAAIVIALLSIFLVANPEAVGFTVADIDPSQHYKLKKIDFSGEHAFSREAVVSVMTTKERPWYQVWKPLPNFDAQTFTDDLASYYRKLWIRCGDERGGVPFRVGHANPGGSRWKEDATDAEGSRETA